MDGLSDGIDAVLGGMSMIQLLVIMAMIAAVAAALYFLVRRPDRLDTEALQRLAGRRGWTIERKMAGYGGVLGNVGSSGKGYRIEVRPTDNAGWSCLVTRYQNIGKGGFVRTTEFVDPEARLPAGMVVIGPGIPKEDAAAAAMLFGQFDGGLGRLLLSKMLGDEAESTGDLDLVAAVSIAGATVIATPDAPVQQIADVYAPLLHSWLADHPQEEAFPILIAGPEQLRIRLRTDAEHADELEAFLHHALETRRQILSIDFPFQVSAGA